MYTHIQKKAKYYTAGIFWLITIISSLLALPIPETPDYPQNIFNVLLIIFVLLALAYSFVLVGYELARLKYQYKLVRRETNE